jgi:hypothetical protein
MVAEQILVRAGEGTLKIRRGERLGQAGQHAVRELVDLSLIGEHGPQVLSAPVRRGAGGGDGR